MQSEIQMRKEEEFESEMDTGRTRSFNEMSGPVHCGQLHNDFLDTNQETHSHKNAQAMQGETGGMEP
jgi:hypothetical protein